MAQKKFEELDLKNAFLFAAALDEPETCQLILELILGRNIPPVQVHTEHTLLYSSDFRSLRLDVYAADEMQVSYNLEMQNKDEGNLPKRSRYHQAEMDLTSLKPGEDFNDLRPSFVIFICTFDPFGRNLYRYTFEERCKEQDFPLGDGTCKIFLSTKGENREDVPEELIHFLQYVENSTDAYVEQIQDDKIQKLHKRVCSLKKSRRWEGRYMTLGEYIQDSVDEEVEERMKELTVGLEEKITERVTEEVTERVTEEVTERVTEEVTEKVTEEVTEKVTKEITERVTEEITEKVKKETTENEQKRMLSLILQMTANKETDLILKLGEEKGLLEQMYQKYHL